MFQIPKNNRNYTCHATIIKCSLKLARQKALNEKFSHLKEKSLGDVVRSAANMFNDDPADLNGDYADVKEPQPQTRCTKMRYARQDSKAL